MPPHSENDPDRFWGRTDDAPDQSRDEEDYDLREGTHSAPISPVGGTPLRKRSLARWDWGKRHSIREEHEAPGRLQHTPSSKDVSPVFSRGNSITSGVNPFDPPSPDFSRTSSHSTVTTTADAKEIARRLELVRSHSDMSFSCLDVDSVKRHDSFVSVGRERKESSASSISASSGSTARDNLRRMNAFWDATPEEIAMTLTRMEWDYFASLGVSSCRNRTDISPVIFYDKCGPQRTKGIKTLLWRGLCISSIISQSGLLGRFYTLQN